MINYPLLEEMLVIRSHSGEEYFMQSFLLAYLQEKKLDIDVDKVGNIYVTKGKSDLYPCFVAHMDINQSHCEDFSIHYTKEYMFGICEQTTDRIGLGFDDKAGIYLALHMLDKLACCKCFFSISEEIGCIGTKQADMSFFADCSFIMQGDRNSYNRDISYATNGVITVSDDFEIESNKICEKYGYTYTRCVFTDVGELVKQGAGCSAVNFSIGYLDEHSDQERLHLGEFANAILFAEEFTKKMKHKRWEHTAVSEYSQPTYKNTDYVYAPAKNTSCCEMCGSSHIEEWSFQEYFCYDCEHVSLNSIYA